ncbi:MAG TPA: hypothetical protein VLU25_04685 [Acidobacteriota bacterium]|nr:hypothetical protein [Acidobacteriota bacterium]
MMSFLAFFFSLWSLPATLAMSAPGPADFPVGEAVEKVQCLDAEDQSYALYLPSQYKPDKQWPVLFAFDPRRRGMIPLNLFKEAAERHQFIIMSSNNFRSDTNELESSERALMSIWNEAISRFSIDARRIYSTGFSGGARISWVFDQATQVPFAGIIGVGAGFPWNGDLIEGYDNPHMTFFGLVGETDFNFYEMHGMSRRLREEGIPHRVVTFPGAHQWPSARECSRAMDWMAIRDMKAGRRPADRTLADEIFQEGLKRAADLQLKERLVDARRELESLVADFEGLCDTAPAARLLEDLRKSKRLARAEKKRRKEADTALALQERALGILHWARTARWEEVPAVTHLRFEMRLAPLLKRSRSDDREQSLAAQRVLENIFVQSAFYFPAEMSARGDHRRAMLFMEVASEIKPEHPFLWYRMAVTESEMGNEGGALKALEKAVECGFNRKDILETAPQWEGLRQKERFQALLARMGEASR